MGLPVPAGEHRHLRPPPQGGGGGFRRGGGGRGDGGGGFINISRIVWETAGCAGDRRIYLLITFIYVGIICAHVFPLKKMGFRNYPRGFSLLSPYIAF